MPLQATSGAASYDAFGGGVVAEPNYIESCFSTYLYTGNGSTQTINNGIDLADKGGLVWLKGRSFLSTHGLYDTTRGVQKPIFSNTTSAQNSDAGGGSTSGLYAFNSNGFSIGPNWAVSINSSGQTFASWTFRKQPKFFDVVTYTTVSGAMTIPHNLGAVPGCWIIKSTSAGSTAPDWWVQHRSIPGQLLRLNETSAVESGFSTATSTNITISNGVYGVGETLVIYLFAHNAGGFGLTGTDNVISCGSFTGNTTVNLGYEPQWVLVKNYAGADSWTIMDNMRGMPVTGFSQALLRPNTNGEEGVGAGVFPTATGFTTTAYAGLDCIYIAIRRGPMKVPTDATKVFNVVSQTPSGTTTVTNSFASDMVLSCQRSNAAGWGFNVADKLRGSSIASGSRYLTTPTTAAEGNFSGFGFNLTNTDVQENFWNAALGVSTPVVYDVFQRAPGFFDEVCYNGFYNGGAPRNLTHNLGVTPEFIIVKCRSTASTNWVSCTKNGSANSVMLVNSTAASNTISGPGYPSVVDSTSTTFQVREFANMNDVNENGRTYVAYLFASCPGVSKVGSYTGTGTSQVINCGFTGGARFVLIKRTDAAGDWYVWDTARGIVAGNDPYLLLNSTAAEMTLTDFVDPVSTGFELSSTALATVNVSGGTYIFLAIA